MRDNSCPCDVYMQPPLVRDLPLTPFAIVSVPSVWMVAWAALYIVAALLIAVRPVVPHVRILSKCGIAASRKILVEIIVQNA